MKAADWRLVLTPDCPDRHGMSYGIDNGAFRCWQQGTPFDVHGFRDLLHGYGPESDWVVVPDIVAAGLESLSFSLAWLDECQRWCKRSLLAVQDGMTPEHIINYMGPDVGIFVGGTVTWKLETLPAWADLAAFMGAYLHVGRVNTARRIRFCGSLGADSFDGTSATKYANSIPLLDFARKQGCFLL